jgi:HlyD family secretion protein
MKMTRKRLLLLLAAGVLIALIIVVLLPEPLEVEAAKMQRGPMQVTVDDQGETRSHDRFVVAAPVAGRLMHIELHAGDRVAENQVLAQIAPLPLSAREYDEITARVASAEALQREAEQLVRRAEENFAHAQREHDRTQKLVKGGSISRQEAEQAANVAATAAIELEAARFRLKAAISEVKVARSGLSAVKSKGQALVSVRAPMAGWILRIPDASERVVAAGTPVLTLGDLTKLEIVAELLSSEAVKVKPGMPLLVEGWGGDQALRAKVRMVEPYAVTKVSALGIEEKRTNVIADFVDPPGPLGDGFRITARIIIWQADNVLKVPASGLFRCGDGWCVFTIEDGEAKRRTVKIGRRNPLEAQVLSGLDEGQTVIRFPGNQVNEGMRVRVRQ